MVDASSADTVPVTAIDKGKKAGVADAWSEEALINKDKVAAVAVLMTRLLLESRVTIVPVYAFVYDSNTSYFVIGQNVLSTENVELKVSNATVLEPLYSS